jgi:bisanhydrobacterioruberin hydratase
MKIKIACPVEKSVRVAILSLIVLYVVQIVGLLIPRTSHLFRLIMPVLILISLTILLAFHKPWDRLHILFFSGVVVLTFLIEAFGANTGILFGEFIYGDSLSFKIFNTPIVIGFYWLLITYSALQLIRSVPGLRRYAPVLAGVLMLFFDFMLERVAMKTGMWIWIFNDIPWKNYAMWFVVSAAIASLFELLEIKTESKVAGLIFILQLILVILVNCFLS